jgi:hypothetical protein
MMKLANTATTDQATIDKILAADTSKSQKIINLFNAGVDNQKIAKLMNIRTNFAYNVLSNYVRMNDLDVDKTNKGAIKDAIIVMIKAGKTNVEISQALKIQYNRVWQVRNEYEAE